MTSSEGIVDGPGGAFDGMGGNMDLTNEMNMDGSDATVGASVFATGTMTRGGVTSTSTTNATTNTGTASTSTSISHPSKVFGSQLLSESISSRKPATSTVPIALVPAPGSGWGLVDADGSEEGYGVVGLEPTMVDLLDPEPLDHHR